MQLGSDQVLVNLDIRFRRGLKVQDLESAIDRFEKNIRENEPTVARIFIEVDLLKSASGARPSNLTKPRSNQVSSTRQAGPFHCRLRLMPGGRRWELKLQN
jgi:hypothetical protein